MDVATAAAGGELIVVARLDTGWHANPKVLRLSAYGMALHAWSISYCDFSRSDGFIPEGAWPTKLRRGVDELRDAHLWHSCEQGYQLHDYLKYNRSRLEMELEQAGTRERVTRYRDRRNAAGNTVTESPGNGVTLARAGAPGPGPGPGVTPVGVTPVNPQTPLPDADAHGGSAPRVGSDEPAIIHAQAGVCPLCRQVYTGAYLDHTAEFHKVRPEPDTSVSHWRLPAPDAALPDEVMTRLAQPPIA